MPRNLLAACLFAVAAPLAAQSTGTPVFHAPYRPFERYEIGANVSDAGNIAIEGFYGFSHAGARWDFGLRAGILDYSGTSNAAVLIGVDARYRVIDQTEDFPLDGALITGVGGQLVEDGSVLLIPIGLSLGRRVNFENSTSSLVPYVQPVLVPMFGSGDSDVLVALGLGADLRINRKFELRLGIGVGDIENFSLGISITR
jgi:hypothetical protein